ncbi:unnamed protein product [Caenorhabditis bovis]|uniref:C2H2-type domain-containing protein n=1 Tax=Caenorhabditis bovis TaxID=2654633 RepID=A0A8S1EP97_9PELO|nr:unnamed protein product [Caenorhabditis bovis]
MDSSTTIQIKCPLCSCADLASPEMLCGHLAQFHDCHTIMQSNTFESFAMFQIWLSEIEDSRCDGGYLGSSQGPFYEDEYYLLCRRNPPTQAKRRRMSDDNSAIITCTAFVHVFETMDGRVTVRYCLDHCGHTPDEVRVRRRASSCAYRRRDMLKRSSPCESEDDCQTPLSPSTSVDSTSTLDDDLYKELFDMTSLNAFISQRLDSTADRLKTLTKVLADIAVDIRNNDLAMVN